MALLIILGITNERRNYYVTHKIYGFNSPSQKCEKVLESNERKIIKVALAYKGKEDYDYMHFCPQQQCLCEREEKIWERVGERSE